MKRSVFAVSALALAGAGPALADTSDRYGHPHMYGSHEFGMFMGPMFMLIFLAALVVGVVFLIRWTATGAGASQAKSNQALDALNLRFANGEIDAKEYAERKKLLIG